MFHGANAVGFSVEFVRLVLSKVTECRLLAFVCAPWNALKSDVQ